MRSIAICLLVVLSGWSCKTDKTTAITIVDKDFVKQEVIGKDVQLLDVRTAAEFEAGHIDDAVNFDVKNTQQFLKQIETLDKTQPVYLYCKLGGRSNKAAELLSKNGFSQIFDYSGGWQDWSKE